MTATEKAKELVEKYKPLVEYNEPWPAKQCALIAVDEILKENERLFSGYKDMVTYKFWQQVKEAINSY